jgi:hypothetical protein
MDCDWSILSTAVSAEGVVISAQYRCILRGHPDITTEGWWGFADATALPLAVDMTEATLLDRVKCEAMRDGRNVIESGLLSQQQAPASLPAPWRAQTFTVGS